MKTGYITIVAILCCLFANNGFSQVGVAQNVVDTSLIKHVELDLDHHAVDYSKGSILTLDDSTIFMLPPVKTLIDNAKESAQVQFYKMQKDVDEREIKSIKRQWLNFFKFNASYQYGITNGYMVYQETGIASNDRYSNQAQSYFLVGGSIALPLVEIYDRANRIKKQKLMTKEKDYQAQMWHDDQAFRIIDCYTQVLEYLNSLDQLLQDYTSSYAQYKVSEIDFVRGKMSIQDLNRQEYLVARSRSAYEKARMMLIKNLLQLEVLSNTNIISGKGNY